MNSLKSEPDGFVCMGGVRFSHVASNEGGMAIFSSRQHSALPQSIHSHHIQSLAQISADFDTSVIPCAESSAVLHSAVGERQSVVLQRTACRHENRNHRQGPHLGNQTSKSDMRSYAHEGSLIFTGSSADTTLGGSFLR